MSLLSKKSALRASTQLSVDDRGSTIIEMAVILPVFLMLMMGIFDVGYAAYTRTMLQGAIEESGRSSTMEQFNGNQAALDNDIRGAMRAVNKQAADNLVFERKNYKNFSDVNTPEDFTDGNGNGTRDPGECYVDSNGNGGWDNDEARAGNGGADDVVLYTATTNYNRLFPLWKMLGEPQNLTMTSSTILRNQPFSSQSGRGGVAICT
jgi:Flp pilus assembly protein TadG